MAEVAGGGDILEIELEDASDDELEPARTIARETDLFDDGEATAVTDEGISVPPQRRDGSAPICPRAA
ncbi:hypothetical protein [Natronorubrum sp. DTA28]|uniref:hypothetical protein n=1 Tax=Natronorubrum sp. DTA28 TaxID=3447019 RepID=UPI003F8449AB